MFNLKKVKIYQAVKWEKFFRIISILKIVFLLCFLIGALLFILKEGKFPFIFLSILIICWILESFFNSKLKKTPRGAKLEQALIGLESANLAEFLSFEAARAISKSAKSVSSEHLEIDINCLLYYLLKDNPELKSIFSRALLDFEGIKNILKQEIGKTQGKDIEKFILNTLRGAKKRNHQIIEVGDFLVALTQTNLILQNIMIQAKLSTEDIENLVIFERILRIKTENRKKFWETENLARLGSIGRSWAAGYTITLDQYSIDWTDVIKQRGYEEIIGHKQAIKRLEMVLARTTMNNALLVGEPGTGRKSIVHALTKKVLFGQSLESINYKRILELDLPSILAKVETDEMAESILETVFEQAVAAGNIVLVIDRFHDFISGYRRPGAIDISGILLKYLKLPQLQVIGICSFPGFHKYVEQNPSVSTLFEKVEVEEISEKETILILTNQIGIYEHKYKKFISYPAIRDTVEYCSKYLPALPFPKKAIDLLEEVMVYVSRYIKGQIVLPEHVAKIVTEKTKIPVGEIEEKEKKTLLNLEALIHQRIINQNIAVNEVSEAMRRARAEITIRKGPIGAFLFLGPTGVGKTETAKALTEIYFGLEEQMIRLDMSEFQEIKDIGRLIGGSETQGLLTTKIKDNPFSLILLDEIEKAHPNILNLFLQIIDEGHVTDGVGRKVSFKNAIIIATSNAGYKLILKALKEAIAWSNVKQELLNYLFENAIFRPEFINRFDAVVVFRPLTKENLLDIAQLMLTQLKKNLAKKYIEFEITEPLKQKVVELGYNPIFGAREMRRVIQDKIENILAKALLSEQIKRGDKITIDQNFAIIKKP